MATLHPYFGLSKKKGYRKTQANEYNATHMRRYGINVNKKREKKIIKWLEANKPYQSAIKRLILEQIEREKASK